MSLTPATVIETKDDVVIVHLQVPDLNEQNTKAVHTDVHAAAAQSPGLPFVLDLAKVKYLPSLTLGAMVRLAGEFKGRGQRLMLASMQPTVRQVITITRLDRLFEVFDDVDAALKSV